MIVSCTQCQMKFKVDDAKIGPRGVKVRCIRCQTMVIVKPGTDPLRETQPNLADALPQAAFRPTEQEAPTRVHVFDSAALAALEQSAKRAEEPKLRAVGGSFGLELEGPQGLQGLPAFAEETPVDRLEQAPPPLPGSSPPPPLKKAAGAGAEDLFASPFGDESTVTTGFVPPEQPASDDKFMDAGADGPTLELDVIRPSAPARVPAASADPLSDLPRFDADEVPQFSSAISAEGTVTKSSLDTIDSEIGQTFAPPVEPETSASEPSGPGKAAKVAKSSRSNLLRIGQVMMAAFILSAYAGLYFLWQAGGLDAFTGQAQVQRSGSLSFERVVLAPFVAANGSTFWIVRGEAQNESTVAMDAPLVHVALEGHVPVDVPVGAEPDAAKLYAAAEVVMSAGPFTLQPAQRLPFTAVVPVAKASQVVPGVELSVPR